MSLTRSRKVNFILNTVVPLIAQIITIASGFIVPQLILNVYGSTVNGLINSITQFLSVISLLDLGMGAVVSTALYRPLAEKNTDEISKI